MKNIKRTAALLLAFIMAFCLVACHPKDEVAVSSGDYKITSAMYSYFLVIADMQAQNYVNENFDTTAEGFDYFKQEIEGKSYSDYVKALALENCVRAIAYQKLCAEKGLTLDTESIANAEYMAQYNWYYYGYNYGYQYGYGDFLPQNGISYETYTEAMKINYYGDTYFKSIYDVGGEKEIAETDIQKAFDENFAAVYMLSKSYTEKDLSSVKAELEKYKERLQKGEDFETIYNEFNKVEEDKTDNTSSNSTSSTDTSSDTASSDQTSSDSTSSDVTSSSGTSSEDATEEEEKPEDELIQIVGSEETESNYKFAKFADVKAMAQDEIKLIEDSENSVVYLVVKKDINADKYYRKNINSDVLYLLKGDEFTETVETYMASIDYEVNKFAINQFKVKNIYYGA